MRTNILSIAAAGLFAMAGALPLAARDSAVFTDSPGLLSDGAWGTSRAERYDVAARLALPQMAGTAVESVTFPWLPSDGVVDVRIWLSKALTVENKVNVPDVMELDATYADGKMSATLPSPYRIGEDGVYVGISFTVEQKETQEQKTPVATVDAGDMFGTGFWIHTSSTYGNRWKDLAAERGELPVFEVTLTDVSPYAACIRIADGDHYAVAGEESGMRMEVVSYGCDPIETLTLSDVSGSMSDPLTVSMDAGTVYYFGYPVSCGLTLPPVDATGRHDMELSVEKVNGEPNALAADRIPLILYVCSSRPEHLPLFEEYTGTGCGYCPRGTLGMEKLKEMYGDRFIGVAYHISDIMSIAEMKDYPNYAPSQPDAYLDRYVKTDPYFGTDMASGRFMVDEVWEAQASLFTTAHLSASCRWADDDRTAIDITSGIQFVRDYDDVDFRVAYILAGDGLKGNTPAWAQGNYYSGETGRWPADFDYLVEAPRLMMNMTYDHVALCMPEMRGVPGSLPASIKADEHLEHSYSIALENAVNLKGESLIQEKDLLYVVAVLLDASTGRVINSAIARPGDSAVGELDSDNAAVEYFTLQGVRTDAPKHGIYIEKRKDGSVRKVMIK